MGGIHSFPLPVLFLYFSKNMKTDGINIKIRMGQNGNFSVRFHPYQAGCVCLTVCGVQGGAKAERALPMLAEKIRVSPVQ